MHSTLSNSLALYHPCLHFPNSRSPNPSSLAPYPLNWFLYTLLDPTNFSYILLPQRPSVKESGTRAWLPVSVRLFKLFCLYSRPFMIWPHTFSPFSSPRRLPTSLALGYIFCFLQTQYVDPWVLSSLVYAPSDGMPFQTPICFFCLFSHSPRIKFAGPSCNLSLIPDVH